MNRQAYFDVLALCHHGQTHLNGLTRAEIHLLAYIALWVWLYQGRPVARWGYRMASTAVGAPYSVELDKAIAECEALSLVGRVASTYRLTDEGDEEYRLLESLSECSERNTSLEAAAAATLVVPIGLARRAVAHIPEFTASRKLGATRSLVSESAVQRLAAMVEALWGVMGRGREDQLLPAVTWLSSLLAGREGATGDA